MKFNALFVGLSRARVKKLVSSIETASSLTMGVTVSYDPGEKLGDLVSSCDIIFIGTRLENTRIELSLKTVREHRDDLPVALIYESEPNGNAFLFARKYNCYLFSETDRDQRTLAPAEVGEVLPNQSAGGETEQRLVEISLCTGPCSTGD
jgi:hypothetical protein